MNVEIMGAPSWLRGWYDLFSCRLEPKENERNSLVI